MLKFQITPILSLASSLKNYFCFKSVTYSISLLHLTSYFLCSWSVFIFFSPWSSIVFICFSNALARGEYVNLAYSITLFWPGNNISLAVKYSFLWIFSGDYADIFAASLLRSYCSFSSLDLSWIAIISFYILSKRFFLKREELSDARAASVIKNKYGFAVHFL